MENVCIGCISFYYIIHCCFFSYDICKNICVEKYNRLKKQYQIVKEYDNLTHREPVHIHTFNESELETTS